METTNNEWLSPKEAAELMGVCYKSVLNWIRLGKLPASRVNGTRLYFISKAQLNFILKANKS